MRFVIEVFRSVKNQVDDNFPIMIKLGCKDYLKSGDGFSIEEGAAVAKALEHEGVCLIEISHCNQDMSCRKKNLLGITSGLFDIISSISASSSCSSHIFLK